RSSPCGCARRSGTSMSPRAKARPRSSRAGFRRRSASSARTSSGSASAGRRASGGRRAAFQLGTTRSRVAHRSHQGLLFSWFLRLHPFPKLVASLSGGRRRRLMLEIAQPPDEEEILLFDKPVAEG